MEYTATMARGTDRQELFGELIERHRGIVFKVASTYAWQADDREELAQEVATQLWRAFPGYDPARPFPTWMYRIALNVAISHVRSVGAPAPAVSLDDEYHEAHANHPGFAVDDGTAQHEADQQLRALYAVIDRQSPMDRALLLLWLLGMTLDYHPPLLPSMP